ncbi:MAG: glycosyltransferase family 4 protein [Fervidobacterium sp.]
MNVLVITNLYPLKNNPTSGIFITNRLRKYSDLQVKYTAVAIAFRESKPLKFIKYLTKKSMVEPVRERENVSYLPTYVERNFFDALETRAGFYKHFYKKWMPRYKTIEQQLKNYGLEKFDIIHAHGMYMPVPAGFVAYEISRSLKIPFIVTVHGSDINYQMKNKLLRPYYLEVLENASKVIFVSKALLDKAISFGYSGKNYQIIPNGFDDEIFRPMDKTKVRKELGIYHPDFKYVGFVGNLVYVKRADKLPKIFKFISNEVKNTIFLIVGDGPLKSKLEKELKKYNAIFSGRVPHEKVAQYMNAMDVMLLPSRSEGWPCVVLEAQACGTCVIGSNNGGIPEAIGFNEYVVEDGNGFEERFAQRVIKVLKDGYNESELIERTREYTWLNVVQKELNLYKETLASR